MKKNSHVNSKYKTKECGVFINEGFCMYGDRCNFIHQCLQPAFDKLEMIDFGFMYVKAGIRS